MCGSSEFIVNLTDFYDRKAIEVLIGLYGNEDEKRSKLGDNYIQIQKRADEIMSWLD